MIHVPCSADLPAYDIGGVVVHLAGCPHTGDELGAWARAIVSAVSNAADIETPPVSGETPPSQEKSPVSRETPDETPRDDEVPTTARLAELRDRRMSYRDLAALAGVAPETVRRRIARYRAEMEENDRG